MSMYTLWKPTNKTVFSSVFFVPPGQCCLLYATGLAAERYRESPEEFSAPQCVCVKRLIHEFKAPRHVNLQCNWIFDMDNSGAEEVSDQLIQTCNGAWSLSMCNNIGIIGVPGTYRLELNDATAVGTVQVYAELIKANLLPEQIKDLFFL